MAEPEPDVPATQPEPGRPRHGRFGLFAPFAALALIAVAWSAGWVWVRGRAVQEIDAWLGAEAAAGRRWDCPGREVGGYPFRIEVVCPTLTLVQPGGSLRLGRVLVVAQIYDPRFIKAEINGPVRLEQGDVVADGTWRLAEASLRLQGAAVLQRFALAVQEPAFQITGGAFEGVPVSARRVEFHLRPNPGRAEGEAAYDASLSAAGAVLPGLDELVGGTEAADLAADTTVTQVRDVGARGSVADRIDRWRGEGGRVEIARTALTKGPRRIEASGEVGLDEAHRLQGTVQASATKLDGLVGPLTGGLAGALAGRAAREAAEPGLRPLPPLRLDRGRLFLGPLPVPGVRLAPLY